MPADELLLRAADITDKIEQIEKEIAAMVPPMDLSRWNGQFRYMTDPELAQQAEIQRKRDLLKSFKEDRARLHEAAVLKLYETTVPQESTEPLVIVEEPEAAQRPESDRQMIERKLKDGDRKGAVALWLEQNPGSLKKTLYTKADVDRADFNKWENRHPRMKDGCKVDKEIKKELRR